MELKNVIYDKQDNLVVIRLNRPKALNALSDALLDDLEIAVSAAEKDEDVKVVIVTGEGMAFAAGADIAAMKDMNAIEGLEYAKKGQALYRHIEEIRKPFIAAVNGFALGGGFELTLACDLRVVSSKAKLGLPETSLGIIPGFGGSQRLARLIGDTKAKELIFTAGMMKPEEALSIGLINKVVEPEMLMEESLKLAGKILANAPIAVGYAKDAINRGRQVDIDSAESMEALYVGMCFATEDLHEGMTAFVEKRKAEFKCRQEDAQ